VSFFKHLEEIDFPHGLKPSKGRDGTEIPATGYYYQSLL
jgi:hypothetical protein